MPGHLVEVGECEEWCLGMIGEEFDGPESDGVDHSLKGVGGKCEAEVC